MGPKFRILWHPPARPRFKKPRSFDNFDVGTRISSTTFTTSAVDGCPSWARKANSSAAKKLASNVAWPLGRLLLRRRRCRPPPLQAGVPTQMPILPNKQHKFRKKEDGDDDYCYWGSPRKVLFWITRDTRQREKILIHTYTLSYIHTYKQKKMVDLNI